MNPGYRSLGVKEKKEASAISFGGHGRLSGPVSSASIPLQSATMMARFAAAPPPPPPAAPGSSGPVFGTMFGRPTSSFAREEKRSDALVTTDEGKLHQIVMQQAVSGAFPSNASLAMELGFASVKTLAAKLPSTLKVSQDVWMTVLICVFLENKLRNEKEAWELVVEKAWDYVSSQVDTGKVDELKKAATIVLGV